MNEFVGICENYGPVKAGQEYRVIGNHYDYVSILCHGKPICVPFEFIKGPENKRYFADLPTYEDIIEAEHV